MAISKLITRYGKQYLKIQPEGYDFPTELPVITKGSREENNSWTWNGSLDSPTLKPSIRTIHGSQYNVFNRVTHIWLTDGMCQYLDDSTDGLAGKTIKLKELDE